MKISVVTASYNSEATIGFTIESFLAQTHPEKEMLVIDGASSDETLKIVESFGSGAIRVPEGQRRLRRHEQGLSLVSGRCGRVSQFRRHVSRRRRALGDRGCIEGRRYRVRRPQHGDRSHHQTRLALVARWTI